MTNVKAVAVIVAALFGVAAAVSCRTQLTSSEGVVANFDLSALQSQSATGWFADDASDPFGEKVDYYYWYQFCDPLPALPTTNPAGLCQAVPIAGGGNQTANVYQVYNSTVTHLDTKCHAVSVATNLTWTLIDPLNPAVGVRQHYGGGDQCGSNGAREIFINIQCKRSGQEPVMGVVSEPTPDSCDYELTVQSLAGCPRECPVVNEKLCSGHGVCGADNDIKSVRCYCNTGFAGADCSQIADSSSGGGNHATSVLAAFVIILTIALLAMAVVLYRKIKRLNADDSRYGQLTDNDDSSKRRAAAAQQISGGASHADAADQGASSQLAAAVETNV